jgi:hypothetical protein
MDELREVFSSEGKDRLAVLRDPQQVEPAHGLWRGGQHTCGSTGDRRYQDYRPGTPTIFAVLPCVAINRAAKHRTDGWYVPFDFRDGTHVCSIEVWEMIPAATECNTAMASYTLKTINYPSPSS